MKADGTDLPEFTTDMDHPVYYRIYHPYSNKYVVYDKAKNKFGTCTSDANKASLFYFVQNGENTKVKGVDTYVPSVRIYAEDSGNNFLNSGTSEWVTSSDRHWYLYAQENTYAGFELGYTEMNNPDALYVNSSNGIAYASSHYGETEYKAREIFQFQKMVCNRIPIPNGSPNGDELTKNILEQDEEGNTLSAQYVIKNGTWGDNASHLSLFGRSIDAATASEYDKIVVKFAETIPASSGDATYNFIPVGLVSPVGWTKMAGKDRWDYTFTENDKNSGIKDFSIFFNANGDLKDIEVTITGIYLVKTEQTHATSTITWNIKNGSETVKTIVKENCIEGQSYSMDALLPGLVTFTNAGPIVATTEDQTIDVTYSLDNMPFELSSDFETANWYQLTLRDKYLSWDASQNKCVCPSTTKPANYTKKALFAFVGTDPWNLKIINAAIGDGKALGGGDTPYGVDITTATAFEFQNNSNHYVFLQKGTSDKRLNDVSNAGWLGYWNNSGSATDGGSTFTFEAIDPELIDDIMNPVESDPEVLSGQKYTTVEQLTANKFFLSQDKFNMAQVLNQTKDGDGNVSLSVDNNAVVTNSDAYYYFQAEPVEVEGKTYYYLHAYNKNDDPKYGWWGEQKPLNTCVNLSFWGGYEIAQGGDNIIEREDNSWVKQEKTYGTSFNNGALFEITYELGLGVTFRNVAIKDGKRYYLGANCNNTETPYYWNCYNVENEKFKNIEKSVDYLELPIDQLKGSSDGVVNGEVINLAKGNAKWEFASPKNFIGYKYLVVVPKRRFVKGGQVEGSEAETQDVQVQMNDQTLKWIGSWNPKRACVINLTTVNNADITLVSSIGIIKGYVQGKDWSLSAAYLTNTEPTWSESASSGENGNNDLGSVETTADHVRTLSKINTLGVVCLPYASAICGADAYEFVGVDSKEDPSAIWVRPVSGILTAGKPYVFKTNTNLNVTFYKAGANTIVEAGNENGLYGVFEDGKVEGEHSYVVSGGEFKRGTNSTSIKAYRCYLDLDKAPELGAAPEPNLVKGCINLFDTENVTAIKSLLTNGNEQNAAIYDMSGRRIDNAKRGLYIRNGKKYLVK